VTKIRAGSSLAASTSFFYPATRTLSYSRALLARRLRATERAQLPPRVPRRRGCQGRRRGSRHDDRDLDLKFCPLLKPRWRELERRESHFLTQLGHAARREGTGASLWAVVNAQWRRPASHVWKRASFSDLTRVRSPEQQGTCRAAQALIVASQSGHDAVPAVIFPFLRPCHLDGWDTGFFDIARNISPCPSA
jgi:hypothetical protein